MGKKAFNKIMQFICIAVLIVNILPDFTGLEGFVMAEEATPTISIPVTSGETSPSASPEATVTPTPTPEVSVVPTPTPTPEPTPVPTPTPYLIVNVKPMTFPCTAKVSTPSNYVYVRTGPGSTYSYVKTPDGRTITLHTNKDVTITAEKNGYYEINYTFDGKSYTKGYVPKETSGLPNFVKYENYYDDFYAKTLIEKGFPESYVPYLCYLHYKYPRWQFEPYQTGLDWNTSINREYTSKANSVDYQAISSWKTKEMNMYDWETNTYVGTDGAKWNAASREILEFYMDPRNFLDERSIFMFELLEYNPDVHTEAGVEQILAGTFMSAAKGATYDGEHTYASLFMTAGKDAGREAIELRLADYNAQLEAEQAKNMPNTNTINTLNANIKKYTAELERYQGVSPYMLAARVRQEQGVNGLSGSVTGTVKGYENLFNYFNFGAYAHDGRDAITNGLIYAAEKDKYTFRPWNTREKGIFGGTARLYNTYISVGQNTLFMQKFNLSPTQTYQHQYMNSVTAPSGEGPSQYNGYSDKTLPYKFSIPIYKNMTSQPATRPEANGDPNSYVKTLKITYTSAGNTANAPITFSYKTSDYSFNLPYDVAKIKVEATSSSPNARVTGTGEFVMVEGENVVKIVCTAKDGNSSVYTIKINKEAKPEVEYSIKTDKFKLEDKNIYDIPEETSALTFLDGMVINGSTTVKLVDKNGKEITGDSLVYTGCKLVTDEAEYVLSVKGDFDGDGWISIKDLLLFKQNLMGAESFNEAQANAGRLSGLEEATIRDLLLLKNYLMGAGTL